MFYMSFKSNSSIYIYAYQKFKPSKFKYARCTKLVETNS